MTDKNMELNVNVEINKNQLIEDLMTYLNEDAEDWIFENATNYLTININQNKKGAIK